MILNHYKTLRYVSAQVAGAEGTAPLHRRTGCDFQGTVHGAGRFVTSNFELETPLKGKKGLHSTVCHIQCYDIAWLFN